MPDLNFHSNIGAEAVSMRAEANQPEGMDWDVFRQKVLEAGHQIVSEHPERRTITISYVENEEVVARLGQEAVAAAEQQAWEDAHRA